MFVATSDTHIHLFHFTWCSTDNIREVLYTDKRVTIKIIDQFQLFKF